MEFNPQKNTFVKKLITGVLAGLVTGACGLRLGITFFRDWASVAMLTLIPLITVVAAIIYVFIWQVRKTNNPQTLAFWQGLIRYGVAFDLAMFGWEKIGHLQLLVPLSKLDLPYNSLSPSDLFWCFFSYSYTFGCIIASLQIIGALLLLFGRTRLIGVFILLPILANILLMDIFYGIGNSVVVHASIMMLGILYFLFIEFERLKEFFLVAKNQLPSLHISKFAKTVIRLSIIYIPLFLIAMHGPADKHPQLTGKYEVKELKIGQQRTNKFNGADSVLTVVYFDVKDNCVFEFNAPQRRWNGHYEKKQDKLDIDWGAPGNKPSFKGRISSIKGTGDLVLDGMLGDDSIRIALHKVGQQKINDHKL